MVGSAGGQGGWAWLLLHLLGHLPGWWRPGLGREPALTQPALAYDLHLHANHRQLRIHLGHMRSNHTCMCNTRTCTNAHTYGCARTSSHLHTHPILAHAHLHVPTTPCTHAPTQTCVR